MSTKAVPLFIGGEWERTDAIGTNANPFTGEALAEVCLATPDIVSRAGVLADQAFRRTRLLAAYERQSLCLRIADRIEERTEDLARSIVLESGKPLQYALAEVSRAAYVFDLAAEQAGRMGEGRTLAMDRFPTGVDRLGITRRVPLGPVAGIASMSMPLLSAVHHMAPAIACGCPIVLKPAPETPQTALALAMIAEVADLPRGFLSVLPGDATVADWIVGDPAFRVVVADVDEARGGRLRELAVGKRVALHVHGIGVNLIHEDARYLDQTVHALAVGGFAAAGTLPFAVQRLLIHRPIFEQVSSQFVASANLLTRGDPLDAETMVGPMPSADEAQRMRQWIELAVQAGARILTDGQSEQNLLAPTVLIDTRPDMLVHREPVRGPLVTLEAYDDFDDAMRLANDAGPRHRLALFTHDIDRIQRAFATTLSDTLIVNDTSAFRVDHQPTGRTLDPSEGRSGLSEAIRLCTEERTMIVHTTDPRGR